MNDYGFDYLNYITNMPTSNYNGSNKMNMNYNMPTNNNTLVDPNVGFNRGNLFANLYEPYKNYKPVNLEPKDEREALLYQLLQYKFALVELDLYLDTNPNDTEKVRLYNQYLNMEKQICDKYESMYGPLTLDSNYLNKNDWTWINSPWPWEVK